MKRRRLGWNPARTCCTGRFEKKTCSQLVTASLYDGVRSKGELSAQFRGSGAPGSSSGFLGSNMKSGLS